MRKSFRVFSVMLVIAVIITAIGAVVVRRHNVKYSDMYEVFTNGISLGEPLYNYEIPPKTDMSDFAALTDNNYVIYQLNEFNTIEAQLEYCAVEIQGGTQKDFLTVSMSCLDDDIRESTVFNTAVKDGRLYIQNHCSGKIPEDRDRIKIIMCVPDDYKGGYVLKAEKSNIVVTDTESTTDMELSLLDCVFSAENISASNIKADISGTTAELKQILSHDGLSLGAVSSNIDLSEINTQYTKALLSSTTLYAENMSGGFTCESDTSKMYLTYNSVSGNINLNSNKGMINVLLPKNSPVSLRYNGRWSILNNNTSVEKSEKNNKDLQHIMETNVEFTIVTLDEK